MLDAPNASSSCWAMRANGDVLPMVLRTSKQDHTEKEEMQSELLRDMVRPEVARRENIGRATQRCFGEFRWKQEQQRLGKVSRRRAALVSGNRNFAASEPVPQAASWTESRRVWVSRGPNRVPVLPKGTLLAI